MFSSRVDRAKLRRLFAELKELPEDRSLRADELGRLDNEFAGIAKQLSENFLATQIEVPLIRAGRIWSGWIGHPIQFSRVGEKGLIRAFFIVYSLVVLAGAAAGAIVCKGVLRIVSFSVLSLVIVRTAFLVNIPISALEVRYLDPLFPSLDMIALCALLHFSYSLFGRGHGVGEFAIDTRPVRQIGEAGREAEITARTTQLERLHHQQ
jgi:hypothetical protein